MTDDGVLEFIKERFGLVEERLRIIQSLASSLSDVLDLLEYEYCQGDGIPEEAVSNYKKACKAINRMPKFNVDAVVK